MTAVRTVAFHTLGCKLNLSETSALARQLEADGFARRDFEAEADVYVINTCSVTENADRECRMLVRRIRRRAPESFVVITGCYAQLKPQEIARIDGVDLVLGAAEKFNIARHLNDLSRSEGAKVCSCDIDAVDGFHAGYSFEKNRTRAFLKVQDGCDYNCSFCTIPMARGRSRSDSIENVVANVRSLAAQGIHEVVLTGVNLGDFGLPATAQAERTVRHADFLALARTLDKLEVMPRFRISSIEPNLLAGEVVELVAGSDRFMPHFHIPLQSGSNRMLGLMRRRYRRELYAEKVGLIKTLMPHAAIGVDVIVGFPGESEADFADTVDFLESLDVSYLHVFTYSERDNTHALTLGPVVPMAVRNQRNRTLRNLSYRKYQDFAARHAGQTRKVLFERANRRGTMEGYTDNYIKVSAAYNPAWVNSILDWTI